MTARIKTKRQTLRTTSGHTITTFRNRKAHPGCPAMVEALVAEIGWCLYNDQLNAVRISGIWTQVDWRGKGRKRIR